MSKLGVITDGISRDFEHALQVMTDAGLEYAELQFLWDPANSLYCNEPSFPDGYEALRGGYLGHLHMKDSVIDIPSASVTQCELDTGDMTPFLEDIAVGLKKDNYDGVISLESVYHPTDGTFEDGFHASLDKFKELFG